MEKKEEKTVSTSERLVALQIAQAMGGLDVLTIANEEKHLSALINRAEKILDWVVYGKKTIKDPSQYFIRKDIDPSQYLIP